ncbi:MAG: hypothetical protein LBU83_14305 [Bacteroidales bacterium]|jgi:hypothetical protein|nr:hypothetical protein [Bacteroidales bacterium]
MKFIFTTIILIISFNTFSQSQDTLNYKRHKKAKDFFSLQDTDTIRERHSVTTASDQFPDKKKRWDLSWSGLVSQDLFWDTRKPTESRDGGIYLYPADVFYDKNGKDINGYGSFNFVAMNTRLNLKIQAPDALGAKISGMIEGWFMGISNTDINGFALRHALIKIDWKSTQLLLGQTWHPLFTERMFAYTVAGSAGAPFQPFARVPQVRVTQKIAKSNYILVYLNAQRDVMTFGTNGASTEYLRQSMMPEMGIQYIFDSQKQDKKNSSTHNIYAGLGFNFKRIVPRLMTADTVATRKGLNSYSGIAFFHYEHLINKQLKTGFKLKAAFIQNCYEYLMIGGYAIKEYDENTTLDFKNNYDYTNLNTLSFWGDLYLNYRSWEVGLFAGYCKNLGAFSPIQSSENRLSYYTRVVNADFMYRLSLRLKYTANKLQFCLEPEYTSVIYGTSLTRKGKVDIAEPTHWVHNLRVLVSTVLYF